MRSIIRFLFVWTVCILCVQHLCAQDKLSLTPNFLSNEKVVQNDDVWHVCGVSNTVSLQTVLEDVDVDSVLSCTYSEATPSLQNNKINVEFALNEGKVSIPDKSILLNDSGEYLFEYNIKYQKMNVDSSFTEYSSTVNLSVHVWGQPLAERKSVYEKDFYKNSNDVSEIQTRDGFSGGWNFTWYRDGVKMVDEHSSSCKYDDVNYGKLLESHTYKVEVENRCGVQIWYAETFEFKYNVYPEIYLATISDGSSSESPIIMHSRQKDKSVSISYEGGDKDGWKYAWKYKGEDEILLTGNNFPIDFSAEKITSIKNYCVEAVSVNTHKGEEWARKSDLFYITVYPEPKVSKSGLVKSSENASQLNSNIQVYSSEKVQIRIETNGGYDTGWNYSIEITGNPKIEKIQDDQNVVVWEYTPINSSNNLQDKTDEVKVKVENRSQGELWYSQDYKFRVTVKQNARAEKVKGDGYYIFNNITDALEFSIKPTGGNSNGEWSVTWSDENGNKVGEGITLKLNTESIQKNNGSSIVGRKITALVKYREPGFPEGVTIDQPFTYTLYIYPEPKVSIPSGIKEIREILSGTPTTETIWHEGGNPNGWTFEWYENGVKVSDGIDYHTATHYNIGSGLKEDVIMAVVRNGSDKYPEYYRDSLVFTVNTWPEPVAEISGYEDVLYYGEKGSISISVSGGNKDNWTVEWGKSELNTIVDEAAPATMQFEVPVSSSTDKQTFKFNVIVRNKSSEGNAWYYREFPISMTAYSTGRISVNSLDSLDVYENNPIHLAANVYGGNPAGWKYEWFDGEVSLGNNLTLDPAFRVRESKNHESETHEIKFIARNSLGDRIGLCDTVSYIIRVWPKAEFIRDFEIRDVTRGISDITAIREGNEFVINCEPAQFGYWQSGSNPWKYSWKRNNAPYFEGNSKSEKASLSASGNIMDTEEYKYELNVYNYGPSPLNNVWDHQYYAPKSLKVYRRPKTPKSLAKKGNGTSGTFIVLSDISDENLHDLEYNLVFGYTDRTGKDHPQQPVLQDVGTTRFDKFPSNVTADNSNKFWVYALWIYPDGSRVTSGKCFMNGTDENWDGSQFTDTRGTVEDITSVEDIYSGEHHNTEHAIYNINGMLNSRFVRGLNIVRMQDGSVRKVMVK